MNEETRSQVNDRQYEAVTKEYGEKPHLIQFRDAYDEAAWVADRVKELYDRGVELSHQCILFRSAYITIPLQAELSKRGIPFTVYGGLKFYETAHVKDVIAHLKLFLNPRGELAWSRVLLLIEAVCLPYRRHGWRSAFQLCYP